MIFSPILCIVGMQQLIKLPLDQDILCRLCISLTKQTVHFRLVAFVYPTIFLAAAFARLGHALVLLCASWAQSIRDSEFLLEMRLQNLEPSDVRKVEVIDNSDEKVSPVFAQEQALAAEIENDALF